MKIKQLKNPKKRNLVYHIGKLSDEGQWKLDFKDSFSRTVYEHIELGFIPMRLSIIDDLPYRIFNTMEEYRQWAENNLPKWLGYSRQ